MTQASQTQAPVAHRQSAARSRGTRGFALLAWIVALSCLLPMVAVGIAALTGGVETISHLADTVLPRYARTTVYLVLLVSLGTFSIGVGAAWLVTMTRFPGVRFFEVALVLPLVWESQSSASSESSSPPSRW